MMSGSALLLSSAISALVGIALYTDSKYNLLTLPLPAPAGPVTSIDASYFPALPEEGTYENNTLLQQAGKRLIPGQIEGPETIAISEDGSLYMVDKYNFLWRGHHVSEAAVLEKEPIAHIGPGRALGIEFDHQGNLILCTAGIGLMMVEKGTNRIVILASKISFDSALEPGTSISYAEDLAIASDGTIFFTDGFYIPPLAPHFDIMRPVDLIAFQGAITGRLLVYSPATKQATVLATGFWFANGCALSADESFVLVTDTIAARVHKHHLRGPKAGQTEILLRGLPGHPDNIRTAKDGTFWIALSAALREAVFPLLPSRHLRALLAWLPAGLLPKDKPFGALLQIDGDGKVLRYLADPTGSNLAMTTAVTEGKEGMYIGTFTEDYVGFFAYRDLPPKMMNKQQGVAR